MNKITLNENNKANIYDCIYDTNCKISQHILAVKILNNKNINDKTYNTFANIETLDNLIKEYENDFEKAAKFITKNVLNNYEFYIKLTKCEADECSIGDLYDENGIIYTNSLDELLSITGSNKLLLFYLNDLSIKLKLNTEITITNLYLDHDSHIGNIYDIPNNNNAKQIKIGYINEESEMYNKNLTVYNNENIDILLEVFTLCILFQFKNINEEIEKDMLNKLNLIFRNL